MQAQDEKLLADFIESCTRLTELIHAVDPVLSALRYASLDQGQLAKLEAEVLKSRRHSADVLARYPQPVR